MTWGNFWIEIGCHLLPSFSLNLAFIVRNLHSPSHLKLEAIAFRVKAEIAVSGILFLLLCLLSPIKLGGESSNIWRIKVGLFLFYIISPLSTCHFISLLVMLIYFCLNTRGYLISARFLGRFILHWMAK